MVPPSYGTFVLTACILVTAGTAVAAIRRGWDRRGVAVTLGVCVAAMFAGARLLSVAAGEDALPSVADPGFHGFSLYGGLVLAAIFGGTAAHRYRIPVTAFGDVLAPLLGVGIAVVRIGCFVAGCCFGRETTLPWGVRFPALSPAHLYQLREPGGDFFTVRPVHPTQLYELTAALVCSGIAGYFLKRKSAPGTAAAAFGILFTAFRLGNHYLRQPVSPIDASAVAYPLFYGVILASGVCLVGYLRRTRERRLGVK
jgi:phosphatidylglycerol:prolipoprotein diacylglycerol transferase